MWALYYITRLAEHSNKTPSAIAGPASPAERAPSLAFVLVVQAGAMFLLSTVLWPLLPVLVPGHVSGALTVVISLR